MASDVSARDLVNKVWDEVAAERALRPAPTAGLADYDRLVEDAERHYVNSRYVLDRAPLDGDGGRPGWVKAKLRARAGRFVVAVDAGDLPLGGGLLALVRPALERLEAGGVLAVLSSSPAVR